MPKWWQMRGGSQIADQTIIGDDILDGTVTDNKLNTLGSTRKLGARDIGRATVGWYYQTGAAADTELVTINSRTYEFDTNSTSTGDVAVDINADQTADASCTALAAAINADTGRSVDAVVMNGNSDTTAGVLLIAKAVGSTNFSTTTDVTNGGVVSAATMLGAAAITNRDAWTFSYTVTAADVTLLALTGANEIAIAGVTSTSSPTLTGFLVRTSAFACKSPATLVLKVTQANTNFFCIVVEDGGVVLAAGDVITVQGGV